MLAPLDQRVRLSTHPVVAHRLARLRDEATEPAQFRQLISEIAALVAYEVLTDLKTSKRSVQTPVSLAPDCTVVTETVLLVPILRAGLGMIPAIQALLPLTEVAHVGLRRDEETLESSVYLDRLPNDLSGRRVVICDPMLATGGSLSRVCAMVLERGASDVTALCILAARPGIDRVIAEYGEVVIGCAAIDDELDARGYITPGLGDAGDRLFGPPPSA